MHKALFPILAACLLLGACEPDSSRLSDADRARLAGEVEETLKGLTNALNSSDPDRIFPYFKQAEEFLYLGCTDLLLGWETFSGRVGPFYRSRPEITFEQHVVRIQILSPDAAVATLRGGSSEVENLFWTEVLVKEDGRWLVTHEHVSWPGCSPPSGAHPFTSLTDPGLLEEMETGEPGG